MVLFTELTLSLLGLANSNMLSIHQPCPAWLIDTFCFSFFLLFCKTSCRFSSMRITFIPEFLAISVLSSLCCDVRLSVQAHRCRPPPPETSGPSNSPWRSRQGQTNVSLTVLLSCTTCICLLYSNVSSFWLLTVNFSLFAPNFRIWPLTYKFDKLY